MKKAIINFCALFYSKTLCYKYQTFRRKVISAYIKKSFAVAGDKFVIYEGSSIRGEKYISVGNNFCAHENFIMQCYEKYDGDTFIPALKIGDRAYFGANCHIGCIGNINIGDNLTCGRNVLIIDHEHGKGTIDEGSIHPLDRPLVRKGDIKIGNNVWLGENCAVLSGVSIGDNVTIGANSVVTKDIPDNCIAAGIPARIIRMKQ